MQINALQVILLVLVSGMAGVGSVLDQFQTHRPLIACTLIGLILNDIKTGTLIGAALEMMALGWMNIGAAQSPDSALAATISTVIVILGKQSVSTGIALAIPIATAGQVLTIFVRTITTMFQHAADKQAEKNNLAAIDALHVSALIFQFLRVAVPTLIVAMSVRTSVVQGMLSAIPDWLTGGLQVAGGMIVVVGYAMVINMMKTKKLMPFLFLGFVTAAFTDFNLIGLGILAVCIAILYLQLAPEYNTNSSNTVVVSNSNVDDDLDDELD